MPKKRQPNFTKTPSSYVHPSLESSKPSSSSTPPAPRTVNDRISQLRREQAPRPTAERRDEIIDVVTQRSVPPALRHILNIPEVNPPLPKPGTHARVSRTRSGRPPPGPAPPISWLNQSRHAPPHLRKMHGRRMNPGESASASLKFSTIATLDGARRLPAERSLIHHTLKLLATNWEWLAEYEQYHLATLPIPIKESLLSYLFVYGPSNGIDLKSFKLLFLDENELEGATGSDELEQLDVSGLLNDNFTLADLSKYMSRPRPVSVIEAFDNLSTSADKGKDKAKDDVAESWEDEIDLKPINISRFPHLTRLSLANPGSSASWAQLLSLSANLKTLTHLSLAYWPTPSLTPNATTTSMVSKHSKPVSLGGTSYYSEMDDDWQEAANILRRLSNNTYCLKWLDLEGCLWHKALTFADPPEGDGPDWTASWGQIEYINISQGWMPHSAAEVATQPAGMLPVQLLTYLRRQRTAWKLPNREAPPLEWRDVGDWMQRENAARDVENRVHELRSRAKGPYCKFDYGWSPGWVESPENSEAYA